MKNRTEEYWALISELSQPPKELDGSVERAKERARRSGFVRCLAKSAASFTAAAATFVLLVNVSQRGNEPESVTVYHGTFQHNHDA